MNGRAGPWVRVPQVPGRLGPSVGQLVGVLQHGVFDAVHAFDGFLVPVVARLVPRASPDFVGRVARPTDDAEPVGRAFGDPVGGPRGASRRPVRLAGSRSPDRASDARRRPGHARGASFRVIRTI